MQTFSEFSDLMALKQIKFKILTKHKNLYLSKIKFATLKFLEFLFFKVINVIDIEKI